MSLWPLRLMASLPTPVRRVLAGAVARAVPAQRQAVVRRNLALCFPHWDEAKVAATVRANLRSTATGLIEAAMAYTLSSRDVDARVDRTLAWQPTGGATIFVTGHSTCLELAARVLNESLSDPAALLVRRHAGARLEAMIDAGRRSHCVETIEKKDLRRVLQRLRAGGSVAIAPDQNFSYHSVFAPFFGIPAATVTILSELQERSGARIVPFWLRREASDRYQFDLGPAWETLSADAQDAAAAYNAWLESQIVPAPEQYLWAHRRFRTRPSGEPPLYDASLLRGKHRH